MSAPPPSSEPLRPDRLDLYDGLNKVTLVPGTAAPGKRGKGVGFYCETCNLTYRDSIQYLDHLNSKQHQYATGIKDSNVSVATLEDVRQRLKYLKAKHDELLQQKKGGLESFDIQQRIAKRKEVEEQERIRRQKTRAEKKKRQKLKRKLGERESEDENEAVEGNEDNKRQAQDMAAMMGFSNFGTSSKTWSSMSFYGVPLGKCMACCAHQSLDSSTVPVSASKTLQLQLQLRCHSWWSHNSIIFRQKLRVPIILSPFHKLFLGYMSLSCGATWSVSSNYKIQIQVSRV